MHGTGNDYIYLDCTEWMPKDPGALSRKMSLRHFSVGADGLVLIFASARADAEMRMFNADGSEGNICGNALCCVGKYLYDSGLCRRTELTVGTRSGIRRLWLFPEEGNPAMQVRVEMGNVSFSSKAVPVCRAAPMIDEALTMDGKTLRVTALSVGNPHAVLFTDAAQVPEPEQFAAALERSRLFPGGVNTEVVFPVSPGELRMRVYERGSGETLACGSGACAAVAAAVATGICAPEREIRVCLPGGVLQVLCTAENRVYLTGTAQTVYEGVYENADSLE